MTVVIVTDRADIAAAALTTVSLASVSAGLRGRTPCAGTFLITAVGSAGFRRLSFVTGHAGAVTALHAVFRRRFAATAITPAVVRTILGSPFAVFFIAQRFAVIYTCSVAAALVAAAFGRAAGGIISRAVLDAGT